MRIKNNNFLKNKFFLSILIFIASFLYLGRDIDASGETMDEWYHYFVSNRTFGAIIHLDLSEKAWGYRTDQPPVYKFFYGPTTYLTDKLDKENPSYSQFNLTYTRLTSVAITSLTSVLLFLFAWQFFSPFVAFLGTLIFILLPPVIAYARVTSSDTPVMLTYFLAVFTFLLALRKGGNNKFYLLTSVTAGIALGAKYNNFLLLPLFAVLYILYNYKQIIKERLIKIPLNAALILPLSLILFFLMWPWIWSDQLDRFLTSFKHWQEVGSGFSGYNLQYYPVYFAITTPVLILFGFALFFLRLFKQRSFYLIALLLMLLTPLLVTFSKYKVDGIRFALPIFPYLAITAALGFDYLINSIKALPKKKIIPFLRLGIILIITIYSLRINITYHPYYLDYFNEIIGGPIGARSKNLPVGYWGEGVKEAVDYVNKAAEKGDKIQFAVSQPQYVPKIRSDIIVLKPFLSSNLQSLSLGQYQSSLQEPEKANYIIQYQAGVPEIEKYYDFVYSSKVAGLDLAKVYKLKPINKN